MTSPMRFTVTPAAGVGLLIGQRRDPQPPLAPLGKARTAEAAPGRREVVAALTADGKWLFEQADDGTWAVGHLPTETEVRRGLGSLGDCQAYAGSGQAQADLERIQAEGART